MTYTAKKLATIFGCTVSDLMDINRAILLEQCRKQNPFEIPEIIAYILKYIPNENLGPHLLKINMIWKVETMRELKVRYKKAEDVYDKAEKEWEKRSSDLGQALDDIDRKRDLEWKAYHKACDERRNARMLQSKMRYALERCGYKGKYDCIDGYKMQFHLSG